MQNPSFFKFLMRKGVSMCFTMISVTAFKQVPQNHPSESILHSHYTNTSVFCTYINVIPLLFTQLHTDTDMQLKWVSSALDLWKGRECEGASTIHDKLLCEKGVGQSSPIWSIVLSEKGLGQQQFHYLWFLLHWASKGTISILSINRLFLRALMNIQCFQRGGSEVVSDKKKEGRAGGRLLINMHLVQPCLQEGWHLTE